MPRLKQEQDKIDNIWVMAISQGVKKLIYTNFDLAAADEFLFPIWDKAFTAICRLVFRDGKFYPDAWSKGEPAAKIACAETMMPDACFAKFQDGVADAYREFFLKVNAKAMPALA